MTNTAFDAELQTEFQEVYMQATHWQQDIAFLETEMFFFKQVINRYHTAKSNLSREQEFVKKILEQENRLAALNGKIPEFLVFLKPYIEDAAKSMNLDFLNRYNSLKQELEGLFKSARAEKNELLQYVESINASITNK